MVVIKTLDMYRKVPVDLLEGTKKGSVFSVFAVLSMAILFILETKAFFRTELVTDLLVDDNLEKKLRINFNITMLDLACEYAQVDVVSFLGTEQNVTSNVNKWSLDANGVKQRFEGRNRKQNDILFSDETVTNTIEELHVNGEQAEDLDLNSLNEMMKTHKYLFVDFFAPWCSHCMKLGPTWETLAELMHEVYYDNLERVKDNGGFSEEDYNEAVKLYKPVHIGKVDCTQNEELCRKESVTAYPTLRLFVDGKFHSDYKGDRTIMAFTHYLQKVEENYDGAGSLMVTNALAKDRGAPHHHDRLESVPKMKREWEADKHPGCQLSGFLLLDRVPGNFHILAKSGSKDLVPSMTNVSHEVHSLFFGDPIQLNQVRQHMSHTPGDFDQKVEPSNGNVYVTRRTHSAYHHHLKLVTTSFQYFGYRNILRDGYAYQMLPQSQLIHYGHDQVPEAKFIYDLSPVAMKYRRSSRKWYDYLTSVMAIIGGTFTVFGMFESSVQFAAGGKKRR